MDINDLHNVAQLKAMAYDTLQAIELQQNNLRLIQQRLTELEQQQQQELAQQELATPKKK